MPKTSTDLLPTNSCNGCGAPVRQRRPSSTGAHWCSKPDCLRKKARYYRRREAQQEFATVADECLAFFTDVADGMFERCGFCGQERALRGWMHPSPGWERPCSGSGQRGAGLPNQWLLALWPLPTPTAPPTP